jgi:predicted Holliday junction resolvase-like endonuclease
MITIILTSIIWGIILAVIWNLLKKRYLEISLKLKETKSKLNSSYIRFGKSFEHFVPFTKNFPGNKENTVFLGMPIDLVNFDEDTIKFIEVKTGQSQLSPKQRKIKKQIEDGKVEFLEVRY